MLKKASERTGLHGEGFASKYRNGCFNFFFATVLLVHLPFLGLDSARYQCCTCTCKVISAQ